MSAMANSLTYQIALSWKTDDEKRVVVPAFLMAARRETPEETVFREC
jgi:hypothetical protein